MNTGQIQEALESMANRTEEGMRRIDQAAALIVMSGEDMAALNRIIAQGRHNAHVFSEAARLLAAQEIAEAKVEIAGMTP